MRLKLKISELANRFFFISNLSEWHFSCRKDYNAAWIRRTGKLTAKERAALQNVKHVMTRYGFKRKQGVPQYLGRFFLILPEREAWKQLQQHVTNPEFDGLTQAFEILAPRFGRVWQQTKQDRNRFSVLRRALREKKVQAFLRDAARLFGAPKATGTITAVIIISPLDKTHTAAGGANVGAGFATLEVPDLKASSWQLAYSIGVLGHEIAHVLWDANRGINRVVRVLRAARLPPQIKGFPIRTVSLINEIIIGSFAPIGALGQKYFGAHLRPLLRGNERAELAAARTFSEYKSSPSPYLLIRYLICQLYPLALQYTSKGKRIDRRFVHAAATAVHNLMKKRANE